MRKSIVKSKPFAVPQYPSARGYHTEPMVRRPSGRAALVGLLLAVALAWVATKFGG